MTAGDDDRGEHSRVSEDWNGEAYQERFDRLAASGADVHGEATFVRAYEPWTVLDAGCGTGRVAIELARHGIAVVGVDVDESMLETARRLGPEVEWSLADLCDLDLGRTFDAVVMAGNVPLFTAAANRRALVERVTAHVGASGVLIAGFQTDWAGQEYSVAEYDADLRHAGHTVVERFSTWDRDPWTEGSTYVVTVSRRREIRSS